MLQITTEYKKKVIAALMRLRENFDGSDAQFAKMQMINSAVFSRIKNGETEKVLKDTEWLRLGRFLNVSLKNDNWVVARTSVYNQIEEDAMFCQKHSQSMIFCDESEIGKTTAVLDLSKRLKNAFYLDCTQCRTANDFVRSLARVVGLETSGRFVDIKASVIHYLSMLHRPIVFLDDTGYLKHEAFLEMIGLWNGTRDVVAWYITGDDSLREHIERSIGRKKVGYKALLTRYSGKYSSCVPLEQSQRNLFYKSLAKDVVMANASGLSDKKINEIINQTIVSFSGNSRDKDIRFPGLRRANFLIKLHSEEEV